MKAADVMVRSVITVTPDATVEEVARTLIEKHISGVPVVDRHGTLCGIVTESDLMRRSEAGTEKRRSRWVESLVSRDQLASEFVKSHARSVADVMTRDVVAAQPDTPLAEIADMLERNGIKRVPIVQNGKVVGIVSRANLLQALAATKRTEQAAATGRDDSIRDTVLAYLDKQNWARPWLLNVIVHGGVVELWGMVDSAAEKNALRVAAESVPGVRAVNDNVVVRRIVSAV